MQLGPKSTLLHGLQCVPPDLCLQRWELSDRKMKMGSSSGVELVRWHAAKIIIHIAAWFTMWTTWIVPGLQCMDTDGQKDKDIIVRYWEKTLQLRSQ